MAEETKDETTTEGASKPKRKGMVLGGGIVGLVGIAYVLSLVALPGEPHGDTPFDGPFVVRLAQLEKDGRVQANLADSGGRRFIAMSLKAEYLAYGESYAVSRTADPVYQAMEKDALIATARQKRVEDFDTPIGEEIFKQELRDAIDPLLFPVHVGNETRPNMPDERSGLQPGRSSRRSTMRGGFHSHHLTLDGRAMTLRLDEGPTVKFEGGESDLMVENESGQYVYVDVTGFDPAFEGAVPVGTFGRIRNILFDSFLVQ